MCKSQAEGGQRCAAHTRSAYSVACADYDRGLPGSDVKRDQAAIAYASTTEGQEVLGIDATKAEARLDFDDYVRLQSILARGRALRGANAEAAAAILEAAAQATQQHTRRVGHQTIPDNTAAVTTWDQLQQRPSVTDVYREDRRVVTTWTFAHTDLGDGGYQKVLVEQVTYYNVESKRFRTRLGTYETTRAPGEGHATARRDPNEDYISLGFNDVPRYSNAGLASSHEAATELIRTRLTPGAADDEHTTTSMQRVLARASRPNEE